jgi:tetratricopeptide (TPR) repeat protein
MRELFMDKKDLDKAIEKTVLKMAIEPNNTENYHELAKYYAMASEYEKVISVYESLLQIDSKDMQALLNIGSIWFYAKEYKKSYQIF